MSHLLKIHRSLYQRKVVPLGLCNAAATLEKSMMHFLNTVNTGKNIWMILLFFPYDWNIHIKYLDAVLSKSTEPKFTVNVKCVF